MKLIKLLFISIFMLFASTAYALPRTPGFWINWENHFTDEEFSRIVDGTIASGSNADAVDYLTSLGCDDENAIHCLRRFLLANQLTVNLTNLSLRDASFPNPDGAYLTLETSLEGGVITLGQCIQDAINAIVQAASLDPADWDRDKILDVKDILDEFANMEVD